MEYAYNDFVIALMAKGLNKTADVEEYIESSGYWVNLYKEDQTSFLNISQDDGPLVESGYTGFLMPKYLNGTFGFQDPSLCSLLLNFTSCYLKSVYLFRIDLHSEYLHTNTRFLNQCQRTRDI